MKNSVPFLDPQDASEGVKTFSEGVSFFLIKLQYFCLNVTVSGSLFIMPHLLYIIYFRESSWRTLFFLVCIFLQMYFPSTLFILEVATATATIVCVAV